MKKEIFLERLEALLQDIPEEEKRDAIDYYRDYLEEAGPETLPSTGNCSAPSLRPSAKRATRRRPGTRSISSRRRSARR